MAFSYRDFADARQYELPKSGNFVARTNSNNPNRRKQGICEAISAVLFSARDVLEDANTTFIVRDDEE